MIDCIIQKRRDGILPEFYLRLCLDMFAVVQYWQPTLTGADRGRAFERVLYHYCENRLVGLTEKAGSRTINGEQSASGFKHEQDAVIVSPSLSVHMELKHLSELLHKNELLIFNQKGLDFLFGGSAPFRKKPLYRILMSGHVIRPEARRFAAQWGICVIEPDRLPLPLLYFLTNCDVLDDSLSNDIDEEDVRKAVQMAICPVQERIMRLNDVVVHGLQPTLETHESWILNIVQRDYGDAYWTALDNLSDGHWLEDIYDALDQELALDII